MTRHVIPSERHEQRALVKWLNFHPILKDFFCKNNNEGKRTAIQTAHLKLEGLRPGVSDLFIYWPTKTYHGLWLEVKRNMHYPPSSRKTETWLAQEKFHEQVKSVGFAAHLCYGWLDGREIIQRYMLT